MSAYPDLVGAVIHPRGLVVRYERHISAGAFLVGFVLDNLTLPRADMAGTQAVIIAYLLIVAAAIALERSIAEARFRVRPFMRAAPFIPVVAQFFFGGLMSALFVLYFRSASLLASWPFLLFIFALAAGNEFVRGRYRRFEFEIGLLAFALFAFAMLFAPAALGRIDAVAFLASLFASAAVTALFCALLGLLAPDALRRARRVLVFVIGSMFTTIALLYFTNVIPPVPLLLRDAGPYHMIFRDDRGDYIGLTEEGSRWFDRFLPGGQIIHRGANEPVYFWSAVFAPSGFALPVVHEWRYYDPDANEWAVAGRYTFSIVGGRDGGYRGYSAKTALLPGKWSVRVKAADGRVIGQRTFTVAEDDGEPLAGRKL